MTKEEREEWMRDKQLITPQEKGMNQRRMKWPKGYTELFITMETSWDAIVDAYIGRGRSRRTKALIPEC